MSSRTDIAPKEPTIIMSRVYDAPRALVWEAITEPRHVKQWWGGRGCANPVCEMDLRPGGHWTQLMRFPDGHELRLDFLFIEIEPPKRLAWRNARAGQPGGPPECVVTITLDDLGSGRTMWSMTARFDSLAERDAALQGGFARPIEASNEILTDYLKTMAEESAP